MMQALRFAHPVLSFLFAAAFSLGALALEPAFAQGPGYYKVSGVAEGDVLNIREEPNAKALIVGAFKPGAYPVEVLEVIASDAGDWGKVLAADANGWVSMRFLEVQTVAMIGGTEVPDGLFCAGTEPFWDATFGGGKVTLNTALEEKLSMPLELATNATGRNHRFSLVAKQGEGRMTAMLGRLESCSDGMSDRDYDWRIDLLVEDGVNPPYAYEGCCRLPVAE